MNHDCGGHQAFSRRGFVRAGVGGLGWLTAMGELLARAAETRREPARSIILLWLAGGASQLETFDPHPDTEIAAGTGAIDTAMRGIRLAEGFPRLAEEMASIALVRSMVTKEGDHERGTYLVKTGYVPDPTVVHPSLGAVVCHELPAGRTEVPRHVSILSSQWPARGGFLGNAYDAFKMGDPAQRVPDVTPWVPRARDEQRTRDLDVVENAFARGRRERADATQHRATLARARLMMSSEQLRAFDVNLEPAALRESYGDTPFGRGCLAARRLIEVGVRCVEVTLSGFDSHVDNHTIHRGLVAQLDPAFAALVRDLRQRDLLRQTLVVCVGEFGRTPRVNRLGGRDHWPNGFSLALAGGGIRGGQVLGATDPEARQPPSNPVSIGAVHATLQHALGIDHKKVMTSPIGRTVRLSDGEPLPALLQG